MLPPSPQGGGFHLRMDGWVSDNNRWMSFIDSRWLGFAHNDWTGLVKNNWMELIIISTMRYGTEEMIWTMPKELWDDPDEF